MPEFIATTSRGLADVLAKELTDLGIKVIERGAGGVKFEGNWEACYMANLQLRTATRVIKPILDFPAYQPEELYNNTLKHDFTKYISVDGTFALDSTVRESSFHDQRYVTLKIKDAIADQFRKKFDRRPNVDSENPDMRIMVRVVKNQVSLALDTSGQSLSLRGYRLEKGDAPLREHLAAGLLGICGWKPHIPLYDPMCGSGTFLIEAALMASKVAPGAFRKKFGFQKWNGFQTEAWDTVVEEAMNQEIEPTDLKLYGSDISGATIAKAVKNAERAGVDKLITFERKGLFEMTAPAERGIMIVNPPYGERMGDRFQLKDTYEELAHFAKRNFKGWTMWMLSGAEDLTCHLRLKATRRVQVNNGPIDCRFLEYKIT